MGVHVIITLKSIYESWHELFPNDYDNRTQGYNETRTLVVEADDVTAIVPLLDVDMEVMGAMMDDPEFHKLTNDYVEAENA